MSPAVVHYALDVLAAAVGARLYIAERGRYGGTGLLNRDAFPVLFGCVAGAAIGNKAVFWVQNPQLLQVALAHPLAWLSGQSMVGGLLGGLLGVEIAKKMAGITRSTGDAFVVPVLAGLMVGRIGCFLAGLADDTYGVPTDLPWGWDFGDGVRRHPTQLYEILFAGMLMFALVRFRPLLSVQPGLTFKVMLAGYLGWRFAIDFLKPVPFAYPGGVSGIQLVCAIALTLYLPLLVGQARRLAHG
jgi:prolipoprotein diacylglyceryltransferase